MNNSVPNIQKSNIPGKGIVTVPYGRAKQGLKAPWPLHIVLPQTAL